MLYICNVFFMVLDLILNGVVVRYLHSFFVLFKHGKY